MMKILRPAVTLALGLGAVLLPLAGGRAARAAPGEEPGEEPAGGRPAGSGRSVEIDPREGAKPIRLEAGEVHLLVVLQALSDVTGKKVVWAGDRSLEEAVVALEKAIPATTRASIESALAAGGYGVAEEELGGRKVLLVVPELKPVRRRGTITRAGEKAPPSSTGEASRAAPAPRSGSVRLFRQGEGAGESWLLLYETRSRQEAEEAQSLLRTFLESRQARGAGDGGAAPSPAGKAGRK